VAVDLKIRSSGKSVMYIIDTATSYAVAGFINDKSSQECGRILIRNWYGAGMPGFNVLSPITVRNGLVMNFNQC